MSDEVLNKFVKKINECMREINQLITWLLNRGMNESVNKEDDK